MDRFDEVFSVLTEDQGWSEENARKIMVYCAEQGMNPLEASARFVAGMANLPGAVDLRKSFFNPWNMFPKKPQPQRGLPKTGPSSPLPTQKALPPARPIATPKQTQGMLGVTKVPTSKELGQAPVPEFGPDKARPKIGPANPPTAYEKIRPPADAGIKARTKLTLPKPKSLSPKSYVKDLVKGALTTAAIGGLTKVASDIMGGQKSSGPTADQKAQKLAQQKAETSAPSAPKPTGERSAAVNSAKQETAKANAERRRAAAASFDKAFAAARGEGAKEFTWRGKTYNTKLK